MRTVFDNAGVARAWADRTQPYGRSGNGNFHFDGTKLYSYSTVIASQVQAKGEWVKLFTSHTYSVTTTAKHMGPAHRYAMGYCFRVPRVECHMGQLSEAQHAVNRAHLIAVYNSERDRYRRALTPLRASLPVIQELSEAADLYCHLFDLPETDLDADSDIVEIGHYHKARDAKSNSPAGIRRREYGRLIRAWKKLDDIRFGYVASDDDGDDRSELGWMAWWIENSNKPEHLALIKWRFRKE